MTVMGFSFTSHFRYIDEALRARWIGFRTLEDEMKRFVPRPLTDFAPQRNATLDRIRGLNPGLSPEQHDAYVDEQIEAFASHNFQFFDLFDQRLMTEYVTVVMLSHSLCEALINAILALGLAKADAADLFPLLERVKFRDKWRLAPKSFAPSYTFPRGAALDESLTRLADQRNALVHLKIDLDVNGVKVLGGSSFSRNSHTMETLWLRRYFSLPYDLADYALKAIPDVSVPFLPDRGPIEIASVHQA